MCKEESALDFLSTIRLSELQLVLPYFKLDSRILEIGSGAGWQAKFLESRGFQVNGLDLEDGLYRNDTVFPIQIYDGKTIPFPDNSFDIVYSSNVLEHIKDLENFQLEIRRVLAVGGLAIHLVPTSTWRILTTICHYPYLLKKIIQKTKSSIGHSNSFHQIAKSSSSVAPPSRIRWLLNLLVSDTHGEKGNILSETYYFSHYYWTKCFRNSGWEVKKYEETNLIYSGYQIFGHVMPLSARESMSRLLGGACHIYVLEPAKFTED